MKWSMQSCLLFLTALPCLIWAFKLGFIVGENDCCIRNMIEYSLNKSTGLNNGAKKLNYKPVMINVTKLDNAYKVGQKVCKALEEDQILAIFSSDDSVTDGYIKSLSYNLEIPYIKILNDQFTRYDPEFTINFYPVIDETVLKVMQEFRWKKTVLVYSGNSGYLRMVSLSKILTGKLQVKLQEVNTALDMHRMFKFCKEEGWASYTIDLSLNKTQIFLSVALMEGMIRVNHSFMFLNMDVQLLDLSPYQHNSANITTFTLHSETRINTEIIRQMAVWSAQTGRSLFSKPNTLSVSSMLMFDAVQTFLRAMEGVSYGNSLQLSTDHVTCDSESSLEIGSTIYNYLNAVQWPGLSGAVRLDGGKRQDYSVDIMQLVENHGLQKLSEYIVIDGVYKQVHNPIKLPGAKKNKTLIVTAIIEEPFLMYASSDGSNNAPSGNDRYIGFCADLLHKISLELGFKYRIEICVNCTYGAPDDQGEWGGMVGELVNQKADLALGSFTISYLREQVIDFSKPFMHVGIGILYKVPNKETPGLFSFMEPLALETWFFVVLAYLIVSLSLYMLGRFSPYEHISHDIVAGQDGDPITVRNFHLTLANSFWFAVGTLMQQGSDVSPAAASTRIVGGFWWLFSLFVISSYTANLAAFLTVERMVTPIENAEGLSLQTNIKYGTLINGSTWLFFKESSIETYKRMWTFMSANPKVFVDSYEEGVKRVKDDENYALLMESATLDYKVQRNCDTLMQIGGLLDSKGYGIGTQRNSQWRDPISGAILKLQESGDIHQMYDKWWKQPGMCGRDHQGGGESTASALDMQNVGGIFIILFTGMILAVIVAVAEYLYKRRKPIQAPKLIPYQNGANTPKQPPSPRQGIQKQSSSTSDSRKLNDLDPQWKSDTSGDKLSPMVQRGDNCSPQSRRRQFQYQSSISSQRSPTNSLRLTSQDDKGLTSGSGIESYRQRSRDSPSPPTDEDFYNPVRSAANSDPPNISFSHNSINSLSPAEGNKFCRIDECSEEGSASGIRC